MLLLSITPDFLYNDKQTHRITLITMRIEVAHHCMEYYNDICNAEYNNNNNRCCVMLNKSRKEEEKGVTTKLESVVVRFDQRSSSRCSSPLRAYSTVGSTETFLHINTYIFIHRHTRIADLACVGYTYTLIVQ